jgi:Ulp1 family protease
MSRPPQRGKGCAVLNKRQKATLLQARDENQHFVSLRARLEEPLAKCVLPTARKGKLVLDQRAMMRETPFSAEEERQLKSFSEGASDDLGLFTLGVKKEDLCTLNPHCWLNDVVINGVAVLFASRSTAPDRPYVFPTYFYTNLVKFGSKKVLTNTSRGAGKADIFSRKGLFFPIHLGQHWTLAVAELVSKTLTYYDSLSCKDEAESLTINLDAEDEREHEEEVEKVTKPDVKKVVITLYHHEGHGKQVEQQIPVIPLDPTPHLHLPSGFGCLRFLLKYLKEELWGKKKQKLTGTWHLTCTNRTTPQQTNGSDCGVFVLCMLNVLHLEFATGASANAPIFSQGQMDSIRRQMQLDLMRGKAFPN